MSPLTLPLDKIEEPPPSRGQRQFSEAAREESEDLREDTTLPGARLWAVRQPGALKEDAASEESEGTVQILFGERPEGRSRSPLGPSLEALTELRSNDAANWIEAVAVLKRDVARLRVSNYSRHAAVLLALADALTFTRSDEVTATDAGTLLDHALGLLSEPYIREDDEEEFLSQLLMAGWNLAPSVEETKEPVN